MAIQIKPDGTETTVHPKDKRDGFSLEELYKLCACDTIDIVGLSDGRQMVVDDNAAITRPPSPVNLKATALYRVGRNDHRQTWSIRGTVLVATKKEIK